MDNYLKATLVFNPTGDFVPDTSETIHISSLSLLKMMKHGRSGVPLEVMGLMLGEFIDEYNIMVVDVFSMPQVGTGVTVEAVDPVFQTRMMDILKITGRDEDVVGWYHSHPGFGCYLSSTDVSTQSAFERLNKRAVAVVVDPIQSVKGKVVIDAFRNIASVLFDEPRITTSNIGYLKQPSFISLVHGLNQKYYSFDINFLLSDLDTILLSSLDKKSWVDTLKSSHCDSPATNISTLLPKYLIQEKAKREDIKKDDEGEIADVGKINYRKHLAISTNEDIEFCVINELLKNINDFIFQ